MKSFIRFTLVVLFFVTILFPAHAAFSSLYVFGDALSSTTDNPQTGSMYYGKRYSNGRVWVEVLAQRQGLTYEAGKNNSYWDHNSSLLADELNSFTPPPDVANALFIVWVCNADTFDAAQVPDTLPQWQAANNQSQANHLQIIGKLYAKGVRNLVLPNAVDISKIPAFNAGTSLTDVMHAGCVDFNFKFINTIKQARALYPSLKIYTPDFYTLLNSVLTNAAYYGLTNAVSSRGFSIAATLTAQNGLPSAATNGYASNYIFWDPQNPTAKFHAVIADVAQQLISPVQISQLTVLTGSNRLDLVNAPVGLNGFVESTTNLASTSWTITQNLSITNTTNAVFVLTTNASPATVTTITQKGGIPPGPGGTPLVTALQFYRLRFPYAWNWP